MKKIILSAILVLAFTTAWAEIVTKETASKVATLFLDSESVDMVWTGIDSYSVLEAGSPAFYVFNGNGQWVIVSGDDCAVPVLMHGEGSFDPNTIPPNMKEFLNGIGSNILEARNMNYTVANDVMVQWSQMVEPIRADSRLDLASTEKVLNTAQWGQGKPYNIYCPYDNDIQCVTGCVATAMSIVMRYNKWPEKGKGTIPAYTTKTKSIYVDGIDINGFSYDWDKMPEQNSEIDTDPEKEAVARLMAHAGAMVTMDYSANSSGATNTSIIPALVKYMSYSSGAHFDSRAYTNNAVWFSRIKSEIDNNRPLLYGGQDKDGKGGHMFVCDGYNSNNEIHINWGWNGSKNAWYAVNYLGSGNTSYVFNIGDCAIFDLVPNKNPDGPDGEYHLYYDSMTLTEGTISKGSDFTIEVSEIGNDGGADCNCIDLNLALVDKDGNIKETISNITIENILPVNNYFIYPFPFKCKINIADISLGDRFAVFYKDSKGNYKPVTGSDPLNSTIGAMDISMIDIPDDLQAGQNYYPHLIPGHKPIKKLVWKINDSVTDYPIDLSIMFNSGEHTIKAKVTYSDNSTETVVKHIQLK